MVIGIGVADRDIGGAIVLLTFTRGDHRYKRGDELTAEDVLNMKNRRELHSAGYIDIYPKSSQVSDQPSERFIIMTGKNEYGVIEGRKINEKPLSKEHAEELASE